MELWNINNTRIVCKLAFSY